MGKKNLRGKTGVGEELIPTGKVITEEEFQTMIIKGELEKVGPGLYRRKRNKKFPCQDVPGTVR